ncbi:Ger(x)C family spore germination protein [Cohnella candidum]|uniref:Ger(X)C family spore germination protein n=1 Tax=Cohnella candidum TaxID=2674991 RepID=A0A3G3JVR3_9BACL|nr:Ger(x)C family spore germination protein [Cohnella candidum]AYQ72316.1 Ger(x)C family spore germination protein [Cohnella candidum]
MTRRWKTAAAWLLLPLLLTGCWDLKDVQDFNYLTALGFDYVGGRYRIYVQMLDFTTVAKMESGKSSQPVPVWVGIGQGATPIEAFNDLYRSSQMRIFYGQVNAIVLSKNVIEHGLLDTMDLLRRYYELRYTPWLFGTKEPLDRLFTVTPFFNLSPVLSILHQPVESYKQESLVAPIMMREFAISTSEPGSTTLLPSLAITDRYWKREHKPHPVPMIDGVYVFQQHRFRGWLSEDEIPGLRWMEPKTNRTPLTVEAGGKSQVSISLGKPEIRIVPAIENGNAVFYVKVTLKGDVGEVTRKMPESELNREAAEKIEVQIRQTFAEGLRIQSDLFGLENTLYRSKNRDWQRIRRQGGFRLHPGSLRQVQVTVHVSHAGKLKY